MERKQFTFYESFYRAMRKIEKKKVRADILDAICAYALYGRLPKANKISPEALMMFEMAKPVLDAARKKAEAAAGKDEDKIEEGQNKDKTKIKEGRRKDKTKTTAGSEEDDGKEKEIEKEIEIEKENEIENEIERDSVNAGAREGFDIFWDMYPKKADRDGAWVEFQRTEESLQVLLDALREHMRSAQWLEDGGRFIPKAAQWLKQQRWLEKPPQQKNEVPMGATGELGEAELAAIQRMLAEG